MSLVSINHFPGNEAQNIQYSTTFFSMKIKTTFLVLLGAFFFQNCTKDFEEINKNPFFPTTSEIGPLANNVIQSLRLGWNEQFYMHNERLYAITQLAARTAVGFDNTTIGTEEMWANTYTALAHINLIEKRINELSAEDEAKNNIRAQIKILRAYKMFRLTDLFGDVPFSEAGRGFEDLKYSRPKYDPQEEIYATLLADLEWAEKNMKAYPNPVTATGAAYLSLGDFDNLFFGNLALWRKFANSLRLRHAIRMADKNPQLALPIIKDIIENKLPVIRTGEEVCLWPRLLQWINTGLNDTFREHNKLRMGSNIWQQMSENNAEDGSGIFDPRARIFFETNNEDKWAAFPQVPDANTPTSGGIPYGRHRDGNYDIKGQDCNYSPFNYYLVRDDQDVPEILLTAAEVHYLKAEAYLRGLGVGANTALAEAEYTDGLFASIVFWQKIAENSAIWERKPPILSTGEIFGAINHPRLSIFTATDKLQLVRTQQWLDHFRQPWEAFALWRRTNATPSEGPIPAFYRFTYPPSEAVNNPDNWATQVARMGADDSKTKVWWMK
jgi:hypothetical protein